MKELSLSDQRLAFVRIVQDGALSVSEACRAFGVSRVTGYKIIARFEIEGVAGLADRSRAPLNCPHRVGADVVAAILLAKGAYPCLNWGPRLVRDYLMRARPDERWPAASTFAEIFKSQGLVVPRRAKTRSSGGGDVLTQPARGNHVWCIDYKGQFRLGDGEWFYPLTVTDDATRFLLRCQGMLDTSAQNAWICFLGAFQEFGLPEIVRSDNGSPFASDSLTGLTSLSLQFLKLGIVHERMRPATPTQNARHERMHRTLKLETANPPAADAKEQQRITDLWRHAYNFLRPHQGVALKAPGDIYAPSPRPWPSVVRPFEYAEGARCFTVRPNGTIRRKGAELYVGQFLAGEVVALDNFEEGSHALYVGIQPVAIFDERSDAFLPPKAARSRIRSLRRIEG
jgi:putative transposase